LIPFKTLIVGCEYLAERSIGKNLKKNLMEAVDNTPTSPQKDRTSPSKVTSSDDGPSTSQKMTLPPSNRINSIQEDDLNLATLSPAKATNGNVLVTSNNSTREFLPSRIKTGMS